MPPRLAVIVVTYNNQDTIEKCLESLQQYVPKGTIIVVVDNASEDDTASIVKEKFPKVKFIQNKTNIGFGAGNNKGMRKVQADYYYLHNSDAYLQDNSLDHVMDYIDGHEDVAVAGLPLVFPDQSPQTAAYSFNTPLKMLLQMLQVHRIVMWLVKSPLGGLLKPILKKVPMARTYVATHAEEMNQNHLLAKDVDWVCGASLVLTQELFNMTGGFDERIFLYGEDEDLCVQAAKKKFRVVQMNVTPVIHDFGWGKNRKNSKISKIKYTSLRYVVDKHFRGSKPFQWVMMRFLLKLKFIRA